MPPALKRYKLKWFLSSSDPWLPTLGFSSYIRSHSALFHDDQEPGLLCKSCLPRQQLDLWGQMVCLILTLIFFCWEGVFPQDCLKDSGGPPWQKHREQMGTVASPVLPKSHGVSTSKNKFIFLCKYPLFPMPKPPTQKRGQLMQKYRRPHVLHWLPGNPLRQRLFAHLHTDLRGLWDGGPMPGSCLASAQHHFPNSSKLSWKAFLLLSLLLTRHPSFHRPQLLHHEPFPSLHAQPGDATSLIAFMLAAGVFLEQLPSRPRSPSSSTHLQFLDHPASPIRIRAPWHEAWRGGMQRRSILPRKREPAEQNTAANGTRSLGRPGFKNKQAPWAGKVLVHFCSYVNNSKLLLLAGLETDGITGNSGGWFSFLETTWKLTKLSQNRWKILTRSNQRMKQKF